MNKLLEIKRNTYENDQHRDIAAIFNSIGSVLYDQGKNREALLNFHKSLVICRKIYDSDDFNLV